MRALLQRVSRASVSVDNRQVAAIGPGLLLLLGISREASQQRAQWLADKTAGLRIFPDEQDKLNLSVKDTGGEILVVSQFTLWAAAQKGSRPSFSRAAGTEQARPLYDYFIERLVGHGLPVAQGVFGAMMQVELVNHGPITIILDAP